MEGRKRRAAAAERHDDDDGAVGPGMTRRTTTSTTLFHRHLHQHGCGGGQRSTTAPALAGFAFQAQRPGRVDLRALNWLDVERVAEEADVDALQHHLENLAFASLSEEDLAAHSDQAVVKAFRLAQLTIEYLLHVQNSLAEQLHRMAADSVRRIQRAAHLKSALCKRDKAIALLKKHLQQQRRSLFMATEAEAKAIMPGLGGCAARAGVTRTSKLRLYVTLPDGACAGVLASPLMPLHELKRQVLPDLLSALPDTHTAPAPAATLGEQDFRLTYRGVRLADDKTLRELRLPDEASLVCILSPSTSGGSAAVATATATAGRRTQQHQRRESEGVQEKQGGREKADEERWLAKQERAVSTIERRLADFEGRVLSFLERQRAELAAETGRLWERLPHAEAQPREDAQPADFALSSTFARRPTPQSMPPPRRSTEHHHHQQQPSSSLSSSSSFTKLRRQRPLQPQPSSPGHRPVMGELDIEARVRALLDTVEARVRAKVRCKRVVCSADLAQIKELQSLLQAELLQLEKEKGMGIKAVKGEDPGELRERVARLEARRSSLPQHVQALLAKVQAHVAAAVEGGGGDEEEQEAAQEHEGRKEVKEMATASPSSSSGGFADRQPSTASHRLAPSKPLKQRSRLPAMAFSQQAAVASHSLPRSFATVEQRTRNDDPSIISQEEEVEEERSGNHDEAPISSLGSAALPLSDAGGSTDSPASPAAASQPAVQEDEEGSDVEEVWTEEEKEEEEHFDDKEDGSLVTIQEEEGLE